MRNTVKRATAGAALGGSLFFTAGLGIALAQPDTADDRPGQPDACGNIGVLEDVNEAAAAQIAAVGVRPGCRARARSQPRWTGVDASGTEKPGRLHQQPGRDLC